MSECVSTEYGLPIALWFEIQVTEYCECCGNKLARDNRDGLAEKTQATIDRAGNLHVYCSTKCLCDSEPHEFVVVWPDDKPVPIAREAQSQPRVYQQNFIDGLDLDGGRQ